MTRDEFTHLTIDTSIVNKKTGYIGKLISEFYNKINVKDDQGLSVEGLFDELYIAVIDHEDWEYFDSLDWSKLEQQAINNFLQQQIQSLRLGVSLLIEHLHKA